MTRLKKTLVSKERSPGSPPAAVQQEKAASGLRQRAEAQFNKQSSHSDQLSVVDTPLLVHELQVHQIELEMQNEELRRAQAELDVQRERYFDLYNLAPVGYCTLSENGLIQEANLTATMMLGMPHRSALVKQPISRFIFEADQDIYYLNRKQLFETGESQNYDLRLLKMDGTIFWAHLATTAQDPSTSSKVSDADSAPRKRCRVTLIDITERKQAEVDLLHQKEESQQRVRELEAITVISTSMRQAETRAELGKIVLQKLITLINAQQATLALFDGNRLIFEHAYGVGQSWHGINMAVNSGLLGEVIRTGLPVFIKHFNLELEDALPDWIFTYFKIPTSLIIYPLKSGSMSIGLIYLGFEQAETFGPEQRNLVAAVAEIAGNALNRMTATEELKAMVTRREKELDSIYQVTSAASETLDLHQALQQALMLTLEAVKAAWGALFLLDESDKHPELIVFRGVGQDDSRMLLDTTFDQFLASVVHKKKAVIIPEFASNPESLQTQMPEKMLTFIGLPMRVQDRVIGILMIVRENGAQAIQENLTLLSFIADHLALVVEFTRLYKRAEHAAVLEERSRLARELHDSVTQELFSANLHIAGAQKNADQGDYKKVYSSLNQIGELTHQALTDLRLMVYELRASEALQNGLVSALENRLDAIERRFDVGVEIELTWLSPLPERIEENLYRIAIEALNNSLKHAKASKVRMEFNRADDRLVLAVQDNGIGFVVEKALQSGGFGLTSMRQRMDQIGGSFQVISEPGNGTRIEVSIPIAENMDDKEGSIGHEGISSRFG